MFALPTVPRRSRTAALRGLACGLVLAAGLSTLAGGGGAADPPQHDAQPLPGAPHAAGAADAAGAAGAASTAAQLAAPIVVSVDGTGAGPAKALVKATNGPREPPPYAPGGDDVLSVGETPPLLPALGRPEPAATIDRSPGAPGSTAGGGSFGPAPGQASAARAALQPGGTPHLMLWLDRTRVAVGERAVLHIAAIGATDCRGKAELQGMVQLGTRIVVRPTAPGPHRLGVSCLGAGTRVEKTVTLIVPLPVAASSLENRQRIDFDPTRLPSVRQLGSATLDVLEHDATENLLAAGDFFQEGRQAVFVTGGSDRDLAGRPSGATANVYFLARDEAGRWVDRSAELLPNPGERFTCSDPSQAITADFNLDGKPDVYVACQGVPPILPTPRPAPAEALPGCCRQVLFLSQFDGTYRRVETAFTLQAAQAEAMDVDGDGLVDIVTIDNTAAGVRALLLLGRGDGTFAAGSPHLLLQAGAAGVRLQVLEGRLAIALAGASAPTGAATDGPVKRALNAPRHGL